MTCPVVDALPELLDHLENRHPEHLTVEYRVVRRSPLAGLLARGFGSDVESAARFYLPHEGDPEWSMESRLVTEWVDPKSVGT